MAFTDVVDVKKRIMIVTNFMLRYFGNRYLSIW